MNEQELEQFTRRREHEMLPEQMRLENALAIWVRDMRQQELAKVKQGGRLSVSALAYEEVLKLRTGLQHIFSDRRRRILGRWNRRKARRAAAQKPVDAEFTCALHQQPGCLFCQ